MADANYLGTNLAQGPANNPAADSGQLIDKRRLETALSCRLPGPILRPGPGARRRRPHDRSPTGGRIPRIRKVRLDCTGEDADLSNRWTAGCGAPCALAGGFP